MKTRKKITIGVIVAFLAVVMVGYIYLFRSVYKELHADRETGC